MMNQKPNPKGQSTSSENFKQHPTKASVFEVHRRQSPALKEKTYPMNNQKGYGISFIDIDETLFRTHAKIKVMKEGTVSKELNNQEFNRYILQKGEQFNFDEFKDAKLFRKTSEPIAQTVKRVQEMIARIKETQSESRIILLTARADFPDKKEFLKTFEDYGIDVTNKKILYIERVGDKPGTIANKKQAVVLKYLETGKYRRCRMIDDDLANLQTFLKLAKNIPEKIHAQIREKYQLATEEQTIEFYALQINKEDHLERINI